MKRVFVTDGSYRNALAAVRALGTAGWRVSVGERASIPRAQTAAFYSRWCAESMQYPDPRARPLDAAHALRAHFKQQAYDAVIPVSLDMVDLFVRYRDLLDVPVMLPPSDSFAIAADKQRTFAHAAGIGFPIPKTVGASQWDALETPLVLKHPRTGATVVRTRAEAAQRVGAMNGESAAWIAQEFVPGQNGFGYFGFFEHGRERGYFLHERLVQFPREGGPSVVARSIRNERLHELGRTLLESLQWHGPAMVEFKRSDRDGEYYLIEINPKLWGSLDLAIASGANFPLWMARTLAGDPPAELSYQDGVVYQWVVPVGIKSFLRYRDFRVPFVRNLLSTRVKTDVHFFSDPIPTAAGVLAMATAALRP